MIALLESINNKLHFSLSSLFNKKKHFRMALKLLFCVAGIYVCFLTWGVTQERVSTTPYEGKKFRYFIFLNTIQALIASIVAWIYILLKHSKVERISGPLLFDYIKISFLSCISSPFGYASLKHIDYPTLILGKSCKLVPVVLMNFLIYRKTFPLKKYLVVLLITLGVSSFMLLHPKSEGKKGNQNSSLYGLGLLSVNLMLDGAYNSSQDQIFHRYKNVQGTSMMMFMNLFSFTLMSLFLLINPWSSELGDAIAFCRAHPKIIYDIFLFGLAGSIGQCFIFYTLESFGSIVLVTVTVTRKMFSILLSVFWFGHQLTLGQWGSVGMVFAAIAWESSDKLFGSKEKKKKD
jgi:UDP-galactose transporter B1